MASQEELQAPCQSEKLHIFNKLGETQTVFAAAKLASGGYHPAKLSGQQRPGKYLLTIATYLERQGRKAGICRYIAEPCRCSDCHDQD